MKNVWAIILAAGSSTRMHRQKLLLPFHGLTVIEKVVKNAVDLLNHNVIVVLGSHSDEIRRQIKNPNLSYCINYNHTEGMLSSVICGYRTLPGNAAAALIFLGDQPHIPVYVPQQLLAAWDTSGKGIIIPTYSGKRGHPILIETKYKTDIEQLDKNKGLRNLMENFSSDVFEMECTAPEITRDIDTPEDYFYETNMLAEKHKYG